MSLLEVVGVTSLGLTSSVAFVLLACERENNLCGRLRDLKGCFLDLILIVG